MNKIINYIKQPSKIIIYLMNRNFFKIIPDEKYIKVKYRLELKKKLNLQNPQTFNEKLQWLKLYDRNPEYTKMVDKYEAKKYVADIIGEEYIIPTLGIWEKFDDIDFEQLPNQFVLKCTHDSGGLVICKDKTKLNIKEAKNKINKSLKRNYYYSGREWPYKNVKPRIIVEQLLEADELTEYKFFCFNGKPKYLFIATGEAHSNKRQASFYGIELKKAPFGRNDISEIDNEIKKPINYEKMVELAKKLSKNRTFLRVDFYNLDGKIYCGELTFYPCSGFLPFNQKEWDEKLGDMLELPKEKKIEK